METKSLHPLYISSAVKAFLIENAASTQAIATIDVSAPGTPGSPCAAPASDGSITCTSAATFPVGTATYTFYELRDGLLSNNTISGVLAVSRFAVTINPPGQPNVVDATLAGVPATATIAIPTPPQRGVAGAVPLAVTAFDAGGSIIVGGEPFVDIHGDPATLTVVDANPSSTTGLVVNGTGQPAATVTLANPSDTLAFQYDGQLRKATLSVVVTGDPNATPGQTLFAPGTYVATFHSVVDPANSTALSPAYDGSDAIAIAQIGTSSLTLATLDAALNLTNNAYVLDGTFSSPGGISALYPAYPDPTVGYVAYGGASLGIYDVATHTTSTIPYRVAPPAQGSFDVTTTYSGPRQSTRTADGTVWFSQGQGGVSFVHPDGSAGFIPTFQNAYNGFVCAIGGSHLVALASGITGGGNNVPLASTYIIDTNAGVGASAPQLFPSTTVAPRACSESFDRKSLWLLTYGNDHENVHLIHDTFSDPDTLSGLQVSDLGVFGDGTVFFSQAKFLIPGNDAIGDTALYGIVFNSIVRYDTSIAGGQIYNTASGDTPTFIILNPADNNIWYTSTASGASGGIHTDGFLQVHS